MKVRILCVVLSADLAQNRRLFLSTSKTDTVLPQFYIESNQVEDVRSLIIEYMKNFLAVNPIDLMPTIISVNPSSIPIHIKEEKTLDIVYGILTPYDPKVVNDEKVVWQEFSLVMPSPYSNLIFEVLQNLS